MDSMYATPFTFIVGPNKQEAVGHKEALCAKSPYIARISERTKSTGVQIAKMIELHKQLQASIDGPASNLVEPV